MGFLSQFEDRIEKTLEGAADKVPSSTLTPVKIAKRAERQMQRGAMLGAGRQYAPTLFTVLVSPEDERQMCGYFPTLAGEIETYLMAKANEDALVMDGQPLVRFIADEGLKRGRFEVVAEAVAAPIIAQLREEEREHYGIEAPGSKAAAYAYDAYPDEAYADDAYANGSFAGDARSEAFDPYADRARSARIDAEAEWAGGNPHTLLFNQNADYANFDVLEDEAEEAPANISSVPTRSVAKPMPRVQVVDLERNRVHVIQGDYAILGRENDCDVSIPDINMSRRHAELSYTDGAWVLSDLGSTNGTMVNGRIVSSQALRPGDRFTLGLTEFLFTLA